MTGISYALPKICCRCGEDKRTYMMPIQGSEITRAGYFVFFISTETTNYSLDIPVCEECLRKLRKSDSYIRSFKIIISILVPLWFLYEIISVGNILAGVIISALIFVFMWGAVVIPPISRRNLCRYSGKYFWFSNMRFFREFAALNPALVRPDYLKVLLPEKYK